MEAERLIRTNSNDQSTYGTTWARSKSFGNMAALHSSSSLNSLSSSTTQNSQNNFLLPPLKHSESTMSFMSSIRSGDVPGDDTKVDANEHRVYSAAQEAGQCAFGVIAVDVWALDHGNLVHVPGGLWVNPVFAKRHPSEALDRIVDTEHPSHSPALPQVPGAGLAGYFWALGTTEHLVWRHLKAITSDPLQPPYERMNTLEEAGFGKATGISFDVLGFKGIVIYFTRANASEALLNSPTNVDYLKVAAQHVGTASALSTPRRLTIEARDRRISKKCRILATKIQCISAFSSLRRSLSNRNLEGLSRSPSTHWGSPTYEKFLRKNPMIMCWAELKEFIKVIRLNIKSRFRALAEKCRGCNINPPPPVPFANATRAFIGSFLTFLALFALSTAARHDQNDRVILAPFGALITLLFSLSAAPASQPRTILYAQFICISTAILGKHYLLDFAMLPHWIVVPLTAAGGIAIMTKFGLAHPPAAAVIVALFSQQEFSLVSVLFVLVGNLLAISIAVLVNNLSEKSQYPVYWAFGIQQGIDIILKHIDEMLSQRQGWAKGNSSDDTSAHTSQMDSSSFLDFSCCSAPVRRQERLDPVLHVLSTQARELQDVVCETRDDSKSDEELALDFMRK